MRQVIVVLALMLFFIKWIGSFQVQPFLKPAPLIPMGREKLREYELPSVWVPPFEAHDPGLNSRSGTPHSTHRGIAPSVPFRSPFRRR